MVLASCLVLGFSYASQSWASSTPAVCDTAITQGVTAQVERYVTAKNSFVATTKTPPPSVAQVANTPCMSTELARVTNQFSNVPSIFSNAFLGGLLSSGGPIGGLMAKMFQSQIQSINQAAQFIPRMLNFQGLATQALQPIVDGLQALGISAPFASALCGLMVDMLVKYIMCENPIKLPNLGNLFGSLGNLLPGCAGQALNSAIYGAGNLQSLRTFNQPIQILPSGNLTPGSAESVNDRRGVYATPQPTTNGSLYLGGGTGP